MYIFSCSHFSIWMLCASSSPPLYTAERRKAKPAVPPLSRCLTGLKGGTRPASSTHTHTHIHTYTHTHADTSTHSLNLKLQRLAGKHKDTSSLGFMDKGSGRAWPSMQILCYWDAQHYKNSLNKLKKLPHCKEIYTVLSHSTLCMCAISLKKWKETCQWLNVLLPAVTFLSVLKNHCQI